MNYLWGGMIIIAVIYGALTGNLDAVTDQALSSAKEAVSLCITMAGAMAFWVGIMRIAEKAGMVNRAASALAPLLGFLFPTVPKDSFARRYIATNMVANFLGLGWAATPAGLSAMKELKRLEETEGRATSAMCDFLIINISSLQLIPVNIIAYRSQYGSVSPAAIVGPAILATTVSTLAAVVFIKIRQGCARWFLKE
ncbi:MAG: nucleoside recognition protein [Lachnospiraceae bacterium]|nr:nucleoside recognition protein [Agathobacter sp.]MDD6445401.1 nucleoside recognition protein [Lachnospiraceae bacterium]MDY4892028.1 nucleoside recognition protein [Agathobacter sp.]